MGPNFGTHLSFHVKLTYWHKGVVIIVNENSEKVAFIGRQVQTFSKHNGTKTLPAVWILHLVVPVIRF